MARRHKAWLIVDASQTLGYTPINMQRDGIDVLVSAGHKGLGALSGTGFIVAQPQVQPLFTPIMWGGTGTSSEQLDFLPAWPQTIEVGTSTCSYRIDAVAAEHWLREVDSIGSWQTKLAHFLAALRKRFSAEQLKIIGHGDAGGYLPVVSMLPTIGTSTKRPPCSMPTSVSKCAPDSLCGPRA